MNTGVRIIASFTRGVFTFLEERGVRTVVLHGAEDGFEHPLSDVDFAVDRAGFQRLPDLVRSYAASQGWLLCQVLRHETTAAYLVCCKADDPTRAVALDACSDYQRNGTRFLSAEELLETRKSLAWGGHALTPGMELVYRFAKSAAKGKDPASSHKEFQGHDEAAKAICSDWLGKRFGIQLHDWTAERVADALKMLQGRCRQRPPLLAPASLKRMVSRALHPSGMVVVTGAEEFINLTTELRPIFGDLFFRHYHEAASWHPALMKSLLMSTLVVVPGLAGPWRRLLPADCQFDADGLIPGTSVPIALAARLAARCARRHR